MQKTFCFIAAGFFFLFNFCAQKPEQAKESSSIRFTSMPSAETGVHFNNMITENDSVNLVNNAYSYMGAGVGVGDFNNDGLPDIFFGASQESSKLYINKGKFKFEDISVKAGTTTSAWITGVSVVDINADGYDDLYLCAATSFDPEQRKNKLFINNKDLTFTEMSEVYGLDDTAFSSQAVFFDYDKDGDLDMYLLNHIRESKDPNNIGRKNTSGTAPARDKLYKNKGISQTTGHPFFEEVSKAAGILEDGYGLGVVVSDFNNDGWPDLFVDNDYLSNDLLWQNNKNGTFSNVIGNATRHQSYSSMGVDASDINNDGYPDVVSLDMMPETNYRQKMMFTFLNYDRYIMERRAGYEPQFIRNMLHLHNGLRSVNDTVIPFFSEIGQLAGISETDWSWSVLMADFDNDGFRDMHITNGLGKDMINNDFITFYTSTSSKPVADWKQRYKEVMQQLDSYGSVKLTNYCYKNNGDLTFQDVSKMAGIGEASISNGCAYADLDNDGDLDLIVNNINAEAFVLRNEARRSLQDTGKNFISVELEGDFSNKKGFGSKVIVYAGDKTQFAEQNPVRGYLSTVDHRLFFGIGNSPKVDSVHIIWPDGKQQTRINITANSTLKFLQRDAVKKTALPVPAIPVFFTDVSGSRGIDFKHQETFFYDFGYQQLLPQKYSQLGPFITEGDVNGDGLIDFFAGGAKGQSGKIFLQKKDGSFISKDLVQGNKPQEDLGCLFFDADGDEDLDLFINSGGSEDNPGSVNYLPRLYKNDGQGNFTQDIQAVPQTITSSMQVVAGADYDGDGDIDLFVGGRLTPMQYPVIPESFLLRNDGGKFSIVTQEVCPELQWGGMITSAIWTDINNDKRPDLVIAGEWMPVRVFSNDGKKLKEITDQAGLNTMKGQWRSLLAEDIDGDGDVDIVAGNIGLNNRYKASSDHPIKLFAKDLDNNGSIDPLIAYYRINDEGEKILYPAINRDQFAAQVPLIKKKFLYNKDYAVSDINIVLGGTAKDDLLEFTCNETRTMWLENRGNGKFIVHAFPVEAQFAPVNSMLYIDVDKDGFKDIVIAGNEYQSEIMGGRYDASYGLVLKADGKGNFQAIPGMKSGLLIDGDVKDLKTIHTDRGEQLMIAAVNDGQLKVFILQ